MISLEQFLQERGGKFTVEDLVFLAKTGVETLFPDTLEQASMELTHQEPAHEQAPTPTKRVFGVDMLYRGEFTPETELLRICEALQTIGSNINVSRVLVVGSRNGHEVVACCAGIGSCGSGVNAFFDWKEGATSQGYFQDREIFMANLNGFSNPMTQHVQILQDGDAERYGREMDPSDLDVVVLCNCTSDRFSAWYQHVKHDGFIVATNAESAINEYAPDCSSQRDGVSVVSMAKYYKIAGEATKDTSDEQAVHAAGGE